MSDPSSDFLSRGISFTEPLDVNIDTDGWPTIPNCLDSYSARLLFAIVQKYGMTEVQIVTAALEAYAIRRGVKITANTPGSVTMELDARSKLLAIITKHGPISRNDMCRRSQWLTTAQRMEVLDMLVNEGKIKFQIETTGKRPRTVFSVA